MPGPGPEVAGERESPRRIRVGGPCVYSLDPESNVGGERYERMLLERLPELGVDVVLGVPHGIQIAAPASEWVIDELRAPPLHWTRAPRRFAPYVRRLIRQGRVDLLRGHSVRYTGPSLLLGRRIARSRIPVVLHHHHLTPRWAELEVRILRRADAVVVVSGHARDELVDAGLAAERIHVVVQGVPRPGPTDGWLDAWPAQEGLRLLVLGRLEPRKRPEIAIDALAALRRRQVQATLVVAGSGELEAELAQRARVLDLERQIRFLGQVSDRDKWRLYDSADVLLFTSELEGFGVVVAEAQSRGVPVVVAHGTGSVEAFLPERSGYLAEGTGSSFAAAVERLIDPGVRERMSRAALEYAERFDWDVAAATIAGLYRDLVAGSSLPRPAPSGAGAAGAGTSTG
jgi:glycosyltransferase involved in cell wall biosynthesis